MQEWINDILQSAELTWFALPAVFLVGLLGAVSSCCNIAAIGAIAGYSATRTNTSRRAMMLPAAFFFLGTIMALVALGAVAGFVSQVAGSALGRYWKLFAGIAAILFGLAALNLVPFKLPRLRSMSKTHPRGLLGAAVFGLVVGGSATACSATCNPLLAVPLGMAVLQDQAWWGAVILGVFALGYALPLVGILLGFSLGTFAIKTKKAAAVSRMIGGVMLVGVGFYFLLTG